MSTHRYRWVIVVLGWLIYVYFGLINSAFAPLVTPIMSELQISYTEVGAIAGAWQLTYIFVSLPIGILVDKIAIKKILFLGTAIVSFSSILKAFSTNFHIFFVSTALFGIGGPMISIGLPKLVASWLKGNDRGIAVGFYATGPSVGAAASLAFINSFFLPYLGSWQRVFLIFGLVGFPILLLWGFLGKNSPRGDNLESPYFWERAREILKQKSVWLVFIVGISSFLIGHGIQNWLPKIMETKGYDSVSAGFIASFFTISRIFGSMIIPRISYSLGSKRKALYIVLISLSLVTLLLYLSMGSILVAEISIMGFFTGGFMPLLLVMLMSIPEIGSEYMGIAGGLFFSMGEIGGFLGPFLIGLFKDLFDSFIGLAVISAYTVCMVFLVRFFKSTKQG